MRGLLERLSKRHEYRTASIVLVAASILSIYSLVLVDEPTWTQSVVVIGLGGLSYFALFVLTYFRLRDALLSSWWLLPMIVVFPIGPSWPLASWDWGFLRVSPSGLVALVPVIIGWFASPNDPEEPIARRPWS